MPRKTPSTVAVRRRLPSASMRPRPDAAENPRLIALHARVARCFNEAAARCRGKQGAVGVNELRRARLQ